MRVDLAQVNASGGLRLNAGSGNVTDSLRKGDTVRAEVLSNDKGILTLKSAGGEIFKARADSAANMFPGDNLHLKVKGKTDGLLLMAAVGEEDAKANKGGQYQNPLVRDFEDKSLVRYATTLSELNMPVSEKSAAAMRALLANNPGMTPQQAAFLVSNKLADDSVLLKTALSLLGEGVKTDTLLERLIALLGKQAPPEAIAQEKVVGGQGELVAQTADEASAQAKPSDAQGAQVAQGSQGTPSQTSPLTQLLAQIIENAAALKPQAESAEKSNKNIITQTDTIMQSANEINKDKILTKDLSALNSSGKTAQTASGHVALNADQAQNAQMNPGVPAGAQAMSQPGMGASLASGAAVSAESQQPQNSSLSTMGAALAAALAEMPEFKGTPPQAIERFSSMLMNVAADNASLLSNTGTDKLSSLVEKLFTRIGINENGAGERLKQAKQELFARLVLIEEAISRAASPLKAELSEQANRLLNHVRTLNNIEQFAYMQIPIILAEERQAVELYLFKRKGGRKPDPDDVNILLALDLENMGHCEALLNIKNKDISVKMKVDGSVQRDFLIENTVILHNMLEQAGFNLTETDITYTDESTTLLTALLAPAKFQNGSGSGGVDFYH